MSYPDVPISGGLQSGNFPDVRDLTKGDMTVACTYDANGLVDDYGGDTAYAGPQIRGPRFPTSLLPATMIIGFLGAVLLIQRI